MTRDYSDTAITREDVNLLPGPVLLEFGASWCGHCLLLAQEIARTLKQHPLVRHIKIEDGPGRRLGQSFGVKLWPTLILMLDGVIVARLVRPEPEHVHEAMETLGRGN